MTFDITRQDIAYAMRSFSRNPGFALVVVFTLAVGMGASVAIFTQINAVMLRFLPVRNPQELKQLEWTSHNAAFSTRNGIRTGRSNSEGPIRESTSYPAYLSLKERMRSFSDFLCYRDAVVANVAMAGHADRAYAQAVSSNYFRTLGINAAIGRTISPDDENVSAVAVLSYRFWQRVVNSDPGILNRTITIHGAPFTVIGVTRKGFSGIDPLNPADVMVPLQQAGSLGVQATTFTDNRDWSACRVIGRLAAPYSEEQARAEAELIVRQSVRDESLSVAYEMPKVWISGVERGIGTLRRSTSQPLFIVMSAAALILLIACVNIAVLLLARSSTRHREVATRLALGASRRRILRQLLTESLLLSLTGGAVGVLTSYPLIKWMPSPVRQFSVGAPILGVDFTPDWRVLVFALTLSVGTGIVFGLSPAIQSSRLDLLSAIKSASNRSDSFRFRWLGRKALVAVQVCLTFLLLVCAGLLIRTIVNLRTIELGFNPRGILVFGIDPRSNGYPPQRSYDLVVEVVDRARQMPGVVAASLTSQPLLTGSITSRPCLSGMATEASSNVETKLVSQDFFATWGIPILSGRDFTSADGSIDQIAKRQVERMVVVNQAFVGKFLAGGNPLDQIFGFCPDQIGNRIIGVVANARSIHMRTSNQPTMYVFQPASQSATVAVRTNGDPRVLAPAIRKLVTELDPTLPVTDVSTELEIRDSVIQELPVSTFLNCFALMALLLSGLGVFGMLNYMVAQRRAEIGIRMALGAQSRDVIRLVAGESLIPAAVGIAVGGAVSMMVSGFVERMLFGVPRNDPSTILASALVMLLTVGLAAFLPARRAGGTDPMVVLRHE